MVKSSHGSCSYWMHLFKITSCSNFRYPFSLEYWQKSFPKGEKKKKNFWRKKIHCGAEASGKEANLENIFQKNKDKPQISQHVKSHSTDRWSKHGIFPTVPKLGHGGKAMLTSSRTDSQISFLQSDVTSCENRDYRLLHKVAIQEERRKEVVEDKSLRADHR